MIKGGLLMRIAELSVNNYRALRDVTIPLSHFGCLIGENNSGKSTFLQAISLFFSGSKLGPSYFFDDTQPIRIAIKFEDINDADLARLAQEHRARVASIVKDGCLTLARFYETNGKSTLLYNTLNPNDPRFSAENIASLVKSQRAGIGFKNRVLETFPELEGIIDENMNQDVVRLKIQELAESLPANQKSAIDMVLPTGIDKSIEPMLPVPIYIPAVKDLTDDIKTTESTPFGKILSILLQAVEPQLSEEKRLFEELNRKFNRVQGDDGKIQDDRLPEVKLIESTVEKNVRESFANVTLSISIPPPELKTVFSSARIYANDGVNGLIDSKGDGLRRAIVFSILRSYVELKEQLNSETIQTEADATPEEQPATDVVPSRNNYILLFEEPELFLHPKAQHILFDALRVFAQEHFVLVTTHSPMFFGPGATEIFVKLHKEQNPEISPRPFTIAQPVNLTEMAVKDQFQIICFENNNAAFFADTVVLVEGDSDYLLMPHIAKTLDPAWDVSKHPVLFVRITGKGNIRRYRDFFLRFNVRVPVIADLDLLLSGFEHISPSKDLKDSRMALLKRVDELIMPGEEDPSGKAATEAQKSGELKGLWKNVKECQNKLKPGGDLTEEYKDAIEAFFAWHRKPERLEVLKYSSDAQMIELKHRLLDLLRVDDVYILERGAIEDYYPETVTGPDKPSKAQDFCSKITTRDEILSCCGEQTTNVNGTMLQEKEFILIFKNIFNG